MGNTWLCFDFQVMFHNGMSNNDRDFEMCFRVDNVVLPKTGYFGVSAATGGLAGTESSASGALAGTVNTRYPTTFDKNSLFFYFSFLTA